MTQMNGFEPLKIVEVARPEYFLDSKSKTAMLTVATLADHYRVAETWYNLQGWRSWQHGKQVDEIRHFGEYVTGRGDVLTVCPIESDDVVCRVQVTEIYMVDCARLSDAEIRELGYASRQEYTDQWDAPRGWFMRVILAPDSPPLLH